jgi:formate dehydrogenase maturation protein FdhE
MLESWDARTARIASELEELRAIYAKTERERLEALAKVAPLAAALRLVAAASTVEYAVLIARMALRDTAEVLPVEEPPRITAEGMCPVCGGDIVAADSLSWTGTECGRGTLYREDDGALAYSARSSADYSEVDGYACPLCHETVLLPEDVEGEWS